MAGSIRVGSFRLDLDSGQLFDGTKPIPLRRKTWAVLRYLVENPGRLVTKGELFTALWPDTVVTDEVPAVSVREIRRAFGDDKRAPRYVQTVYGRGFRFIAPVGEEWPPREVDVAAPVLIPAATAAPACFGREAELARLETLLAQAHSGQRQTVFVIGEAGIGKTTLVDTFLARHSETGEALLACGQCVEPYGEGEPFLCVLDALTRISRSHAGEVVPVLREQAPAWLLMIPGRVGRAERVAIQREVSGATTQHTLSALVDAIETLAERRSLIFFLEDLQWSDRSTVDFLARLAQRPERARLMVVATYRPVDVITQDHAIRGLVKELRRKGCCEVLHLDYLSPAAARSLISRKLGSGTLPDGLVEWLHRRTAGNPLFVEILTECLETQGILQCRDGTWQLDTSLDEVGIPASLAEVIRRDIDALEEEERMILEAASVVGESFDAESVAAAVQGSADRVELACSGLARNDLLLEESGSCQFPDGKAASAYRFRHALHQKVLYEGITIARRRKLHRLVAERLEMAHAADPAEAATPLAAHLERAGEVEKAAAWLHRAAERAAQRHAPHERMRHARHGLALLESLPAAEPHRELEIALLLDLAISSAMLNDYAPVQAVEPFSRALELARKGPPRPELFVALIGSYTCQMMCGELAAAHGHALEARRLATELGLPDFLRARCSVPLGVVLFYLGDPAASLEILEDARRWLEAEPPSSPLASQATQLSIDPLVECMSQISWDEMMLGLPERALRHSSEALERARALGHPRTLAYAAARAAFPHFERGELDLVDRCAAEAIAVSGAAGFGFWESIGRGFHAMAELQRGATQKAVEELESALAEIRAGGTVLGRSVYLSVLAEGHAALGRGDEALAACGEALRHCAVTGEGGGLLEVYYTRGRIQHRLGELAAAERDLRHSVELSRAARGRWWELRATVALCRLPLVAQKRAEDRESLASLHACFEEGFDTSLLREAGELLGRSG